MRNRRVLLWSNIISVLGMVFLVLGTIGAVLIGFQKGDCLRATYYSCKDYEYPYIPLAVGVGVANLFVNSFFIMIAEYIEWSVTGKNQGSESTDQ